MIEKFVCPLRQESYDDCYKVPVKFDENEEPVGIMCPDYDPQARKCNNDESTDEQCIYSKWKPLK